MSEEVDPDDLEELTALAAALTGDRADAARLVGETFAAPDAVRRRNPDRAGLRGLLVESYLRRRQSSAVPPGDDLPDELGEVAERLGLLSPFERAAVVLSRLKGLPLAEVAAILDTSSAAVRRRLAQAEDRLGGTPLAVRATLNTLSWRTPDAAAMASARFRAQRGAARRRGRIRLLAVALGIVLLVALVVPPVQMLQPLPVRSAGRWVLGIELDPPPGWTVELHVVTPDQEFVQLMGEAAVCRAVASLPSAAEEEGADRRASTERAWVGGRLVQYSDGGLRWPYGKGGEVTLTCTDEDRARLLTVAERIRFSAGRSFALPFALDRLPAGLQLVGAGYEDGMPVLALSRRRSDGFVLVTVTESEPIGRRVTLQGVGYRLQVAAFSRRLCRPVVSMSVCIEARTDDIALQKAVFHNLRLAPDLQDRATWFDAREALPT
jgi:hypothetical protein